MYQKVLVWCLPLLLNKNVSPACHLPLLWDEKFSPAAHPLHGTKISRLLPTPCYATKSFRLPPTPYFCNQKFSPAAYHCIWSTNFSIDDYWRHMLWNKKFPPAAYPCHGTKMSRLLPAPCNVTKSSRLPRTPYLTKYSKCKKQSDKTGISQSIPSLRRKTIQMSGISNFTDDCWIGVPVSGLCCHEAFSSSDLCHRTLATSDNGRITWETLTLLIENNSNILELKIFFLSQDCVLNYSPDYYISEFKLMDQSFVALSL